MNTYNNIRRNFFSLFCILACFLSCTEEVEKTSNKGTIIIGVHTETSGISKVDTDLPVSNLPISLRITLLDENNNLTGKVIEHTLENGSEKEIELDLGNYRLDAIASNELDAVSGKDLSDIRPTMEPYYAGSRDISVAAVKNDPVEIECKLTTVVVKVDDEGLQRYYNAGYECETVVKTEEGLAITFTKEDTDKAAYFVPGNLSVTFRYKKGEGAWTEKSVGNITPVSAGEEYIITYKINDDETGDNTGSAGIGVIIEKGEDKTGNIIIQIPELKASFNRIVVDLENREATFYANYGLTNGESSGNQFFEYSEDDLNWQTVTNITFEDQSCIATFPIGSDKTYTVRFKEKNDISETFDTKLVNYPVIPQYDIWATFVKVDAEYENINQFSSIKYQYRKTNTEEWIDCEPIEQNNLKSIIKNLASEESYEYRLFLKDDILEIAGNSSSTIITDKADQLPNSSFERYTASSGPSGRAYVFYAVGEENMFWDTGNHGGTSSALASKNLTTPSTAYKKSGTYSVELKSQFVGYKLGIITLGRFAAGNLFIGEYKETIQANDTDFKTAGGRIDFGRAFTTRPSKLKGWYKYNRGTIDYVQPDPNIAIPPELVEEGAVNGSPDKGHIYIALSDKGAPYTIINTSAKNSVPYFFNKDDEHIIAYGELIQDESTPGDDLIDFSIDFKYNSLERIPTHLIIVCSASKYGDYFTGSTGSTMWLDDLELVYDEPVLAD